MVEVFHNFPHRIQLRTDMHNQVLSPEPHHHLHMVDHLDHLCRVLGSRTPGGHAMHDWSCIPFLLRRTHSLPCRSMGPFFHTNHLKCPVKGKWSQEQHTCNVVPFHVAHSHLCKAYLEVLLCIFWQQRDLAYKTGTPGYACCDVFCLCIPSSNCSGLCPYQRCNMYILQTPCSDPHTLSSWWLGFRVCHLSKC